MESALLRFRSLTHLHAPSLTSAYIWLMALASSLLLVLASTLQFSCSSILLSSLPVADPQLTSRSQSCQRMKPLSHRSHFTCSSHFHQRTGGSCRSQLLDWQLQG